MNIYQSKICTKCDISKNLTEFPIRNNSKDGHAGQCKLCCQLYNKNWKKSNPEYYKTLWKDNKLSETDRRLTRLYGTTLDQYNNLLRIQNGKCKICGKSATEFKRNLAVDHCHKTGKPRSLLCSNCNTGLGAFKDSIELLGLAQLYIKEHESPIEGL
jgi:hypothetical protein